MLARVKENAGIRVVHHGRVADLEALQMQELCRNHDGGGVHRPLGRSVAMVRAYGHREIRRVKNRPLARISEVMDAFVVACAACGQQDSRRHFIARVKDRVVQVIDSAANPHRIACGHHGVRLVQRRERLVL